MRELQSCGISRPNDDSGYTVTHVSTREKEGFFLCFDSVILIEYIAIVKTSFLFHVLLERCLKANIYICFDVPSCSKYSWSCLVCWLNI
jgi:hypothetical protein